MKDIIFPITYKSDPKGLNDAEQGLGKLSGVAVGVGVATTAAFAAAAAGAVALGLECVKAAAESRAVFQGLQNAVENSGAFVDAAGGIKQVTKELDAHSKKLGELTGIDDEIINSVKRGWMAVPSIAATGVAGINNLAKVSADIAAGTGKDIESIALMFTKAAGDQETAMSKLQRAGVVLTQVQKDTYQALLDTGDEAGAQAYLIETLGQKYAGAAEAGADPFARLGVIIGNLAEDIGVYLLPIVDTMVAKFQEYIQTHGPQLQTAMEKVAGAVMGIFKAFTDVAAFFDAHPGLFEGIATAIGLITTALVAATIAQWAFNVAMYANPAVIVAAIIVAAIASVIVMIVTMATHWDTTCRVFGNAWSQMAYAIGNVWTGVVNGIIDGINTVLNLINGIVGSNLYIERLGAFSLGAGPKDAQGRSLYVPGQATGGVTTSGGLSWVGERGPELLNLPTGAQVIPLSKIGGGSGGGATVNISVNAGMGADGAAIGEQIVTAIRKYERASGPVFASA